MLLKRKYLFGTTVLAGVMAATAPALAQESQLPGVNVQGQQPQEVTEIEEVVVTGSRIRRDPTNAPTPLIQVSREELLSTGQTSVIEYLATIPALSNSQVPSDTTAGVLNAGGLSLPNLRSLGSGRTLTLVDGRRHVGSAAGSLSVDVDTIPRLLIENVEIITGGASSVYGADAVSGVLNFTLRRDFEGLELDARAAQINQDGEMQYRFSVLSGANLLDDRLNVYAFGEYERNDELLASDIDWLQEGWVLSGNDADPSAAPIDGDYDVRLWENARTLQLLRWGQVTLANNYQPSPLNDPDVSPIGACTSGSVTSSQCFGVSPGYTYVFDGATARLADFGTRVQQTGTNRVINVGGDGENPNTVFNVDAVYPESESKRFQTGANFALTPDINLRLEAKYIDEETNLATGYAFADVYITDIVSPFNSMQILSARTGSPAAFLTRTDNAFMPANLSAAILGNTTPTYCLNTAGCAGGIAYGAQTGVTAAPFARYSAWTLDRPQTNYKELQRYVVSMDGNLNDIGFFRNGRWDIGYTYGRVDNENHEFSVDGERFSYALDAVVDAAGVFGAPGEIVCRVQRETANGGLVTNRNPYNPALNTGVGGATMGANDPDVAQCVPLNIFGMGNQDPAALDYVRSEITINQLNEQHDAVAAISGELWDALGAGPVGVALGAEWRKEYTEGTGRDRTTAGRWLLSNTGPDFLGRSYEAKEWFAELSIPLIRDHWLGEYAELSGSYRYSDFSNFGGSDVYGVNLVYRPIQDIAIKTSLNTSVRAPSLGELYSPATQTFSQPTDPCDALVINNLADREVADRRIVNCEALAAQAGFAGVFNFSNPQAGNAYRPQYPSSVAGFNQGNAGLQPEESESFTFSTVFEPRFFPNFALVLDYYEIQIDNVISSVSAQTNANLCVGGELGAGNTANLAPEQCGRITRATADDPSTPRDDRFVITSFIQDSQNYAKRTVRGLDFTARYALDTAEAFDRNWGRFNFSLNGSWLIEQKQFNDITNPDSYSQLESSLFYPRVRFTSQIAWQPTDALSVTWTTDWQTSQDITERRNFIGNFDNRELRYLKTGNFMRNDISVNYDLRDDLTLRAGVVNVFDAEQAEWLGGTIYSNFDPFGRRFSIGLNWRPY